MMRKIVRVLSVICLLLLMAVPALADWSFTADYVTGEMETKFLKSDLTEKKDQSDLTGGILGFGFTKNHFLFNYDFIYKDLDTAIAGDDVNRLYDLRLGYRFYDTSTFKAAVLLSHICDECGNFEAEGPTLGLGVEWAISGKWLLEGRVGYCSEGVTVENPPYREYDDPELLTLAASLNYQLTDCWSVHSSYRYYKFAADNYGVDLKSTVGLASVGVTYKVPCITKAAETEATEETTEEAEEAEATAETTEEAEEAEATAETTEEAEEAEATEETTEEAEEAEATTESAEEVEEAEATEETVEEAEEAEVTEETVEEAEEAEATAETTEEAEEAEATSEATEEPKITPRPGEQGEMKGLYLQPIFFDFNKAEIRPDQVTVLEQDLVVLKKHCELQILVGGHADPKGKADYNKRLSLRRAENVKAWLLDNGIDAARMTVVAYGETSEYFHTEKGSDWESDRLVEIMAIAKTPSEAVETCE